MNRIAVLSSPCANMKALKSIQKDAASKGVQEFVCLGNVLPYGNDVTEVVEWIIANCSFCLKGLPERAISDRAAWIGVTRRHYVETTLRNTESVQKDCKLLSFLTSLDRTKRHGDALFADNVTEATSSWSIGGLPCFTSADIAGGKCFSERVLPPSLHEIAAPLVICGGGGVHWQYAQDTGEIAPWKFNRSLMSSPQSPMIVGGICSGGWQADRYCGEGSYLIVEGCTVEFHLVTFPDLL